MIVADALSRLETEPTNESIAEAKDLVYIREANAVISVRGETYRLSDRLR